MYTGSMMDLLTKDDYLKNFRGITSSLKRKFVKRLNINDALITYDSLSKQQTDAGFTELGADCKLSAALLDQHAGTGLAATSVKGSQIGSHFIESARLYAQSNDRKLSAFCYQSAAGSEEGSLSWLTTMEAGRTAMDLSDFESATQCFTKALKNAKGEYEKRMSSEQLASAYIHQDLHQEAFKLLSDLKGVTADCKLTVAILDLLVHKTSQGVSGTHALERVSEHLSQLGALQFDEINVAQQYSNEAVNTVVFANVWKYLNMDQQYLLTKYFCSGKLCT